MTFLLVFATLLWTLGLVLAVLGKLLRAPGHNARIVVRPLPWPRIEIAVEAVGPADREPPADASGTNGRNTDVTGAHAVHTCPDREISTA